MPGNSLKVSNSHESQQPLQLQKVEKYLLENWEFQILTKVSSLFNASLDAAQDAYYTSFNFSRTSAASSTQATLMMIYII
jgi:hypothetical protein